MEPAPPKTLSALHALHELHTKLGRLLCRVQGTTDDGYLPPKGGLLADYLRAVDDLGKKYGAAADVERFYPSQDKGADEWS